MESIHKHCDQGLVFVVKHEIVQIFSLMLWAVDKGIL